jgi:phage portal protein BeeE
MMSILENERREMQIAFDAQTAGAHNMGKTYVSTVGVDFAQIGMSAEDLRLIEFNIEYLRTACSLYGIDSSIFNDPANKTYANRAEAETAMYSDVILPLAGNIYKQLSEWLLQDKFKLTGTTFFVDDSKIKPLQENKKQKQDSVLASVQAGLITKEEGRAMLYPELQPLLIQSNE